MDPVFLLDTVRAGHLIGLAFGLGLALCADILALTTLFRKITATDLTLLKWMHWVVYLGLGILWVSGLLILWMQTGGDPAAISPMMITKLVVTLLLTLNARMIGSTVLPVLKRNVGKRFGALPLVTRIHFGAIAALSLACWLSALALGAFTHLEQMGFSELQVYLAPPILLGLVVPIMTGISARILGRVDQEEAFKASLRPTPRAEFSTNAGKIWPS